MMRALVALLLAVTLVTANAVETYYARPEGACQNNGDGLAYGCASTGGGTGAWIGAANVSYGNTGSTFGRGDSLYICNRHTGGSGFTIGSIGTFDGTADTAGDIITFRFDCPNDPGSVEDTVSGHGILGSGRPGMRIIGVSGRTEFRNIHGSGVTQYMSSTTPCDSANGFRCFHTSDINCERVGTSGAGHCVATGSSGFGNYPATAVTGVLIERVESHGAGGAACNIAGHYTGAVIDHCRSIGDGLVQDTWGVYQRSESRNIGACGSGMTWTRLGTSTVFKTTVPTSCIPSSLTWAGLQHLVGVTGASLDPTYTKDATCTSDGTCESNLAAGEWNHVGNVLYINRGTTSISATASVNITLAYNTDSIIRNSYAERFGPAHDGVGIGFDLDSINGTIENSEAYDNAGPGFSFNISSGQILSSVAAGNGQANFTLGHRASAHHVASWQPANGAPHFRWRSHYGHTVTVKNSAMYGGTVAGIDNWKDGGTVDWDYNALGANLAFEAYIESPQVVTTPMSGGAHDIPLIESPFLARGRPASANDFRPMLGSLLCGGGLYDGKRHDKTRRRFIPPVSIGAYQCGSGRAPALR